jgi:hypothetical protein
MATPHLECFSQRIDDAARNDRRLTASVRERDQTLSAAKWSTSAVAAAAVVALEIRGASARHLPAPPLPPTM